MKSSGVSAIVRAARNAIEPLEDRRLRSASAPQLFPGDSVSDTLVSGGVNRYLLSVPAGQIVTIDVDGDFSGSTAIFDSAVTLRTTGGTVLASNTGSAEEANGSKNDHGWLEYEFDQGGDYYVDVSSETGDFGSFLLEVQDGDANDTLNEANFDWSTYSVTEGVIGHPGDVDIHEIFIPTDGEYAFDIDTTANISTAGLDSVLRVFDDQGAEIGFNDDGFAISELPSSTDFESYLELFLPAGTYYAGISAFNNLDYDPLTGTGDVNTAVLRQTGRYDLRVTPVDDVTTLIPRFDLSGQFRFDIDIDRPLQGGSFSPNWDLFNQTTGEIFTDADFTVFPIIAPTFTVFELTPNVTLPDGEYVFVSPGSLLIDVNSIPVDSPAFAGDFFLLRGDANGDAQVDLADFGVLRANFGSSNATFAQGDFNFDGSVDLADFGLLRANFGTEAGGFRGVPVDFAALTPPPILFDDESRSLFA